MTNECNATGAQEAAAHRLLEREAPAEYLAAWAKRLRLRVGDRALEARDPVAVVMVGEERLALPTACVREVHRPRRVIVVPGRSNDILRGLVCLRGEIVLCASLHALVGAMGKPIDDDPRARMVVVELDGARWAFSVDQVIDVRSVDRSATRAPQVTVAKAVVHLSDALLDLPDGPAARLDPERLFQALARCLA